MIKAACAQDLNLNVLCVVIGLKNTTSELFLHKSAKPLRDINFLEPKKQASLFGETFDEEFADECEGICGV